MVLHHRDMLTWNPKIDLVWCIPCEKYLCRKPSDDLTKYSEKVYRHCHRSINNIPTPHSKSVLGDHTRQDGDTILKSSVVTSVRSKLGSNYDVKVLPSTTPTPLYGLTLTTEHSCVICDHRANQKKTVRQHFIDKHEDEVVPSAGYSRVLYVQKVFDGREVLVGAPSPVQQGSEVILGTSLWPTFSARVPDHVDAGAEALLQVHDSNTQADASLGQFFTQLYTAGSTMFGSIDIEVLSGLCADENLVMQAVHEFVDCALTTMEKEETLQSTLLEFQRFSGESEQVFVFRVNSMVDYKVPNTLKLVLRFLLNIYETPLGESLLSRPAKLLPALKQFAQLKDVESLLFVLDILFSGSFSEHVSLKECWIAPVFVLLLLRDGLDTKHKTERQRHFSQEVNALMYAARLRTAEKILNVKVCYLTIINRIMCVSKIRLQASDRSDKKKAKRINKLKRITLESYKKDILPMYFFHRALRETRRFSEICATRLSFKDQQVDFSWVTFKDGLEFSWARLRKVVEYGVLRLNCLLDKVQAPTGMDLRDPGLGLLFDEKRIKIEDSLANGSLYFGLSGKLVRPHSDVVITSVDSIQEVNSVATVFVNDRRNVLGELIPYV